VERKRQGITRRAFELSEAEGKDKNSELTMQEGRSSLEGSEHKDDENLAGGENRARGEW